LEFIVDDIAATLRQIQDLNAELANKDHIVVENVKEILPQVHVTLLQELDIEQKKSLICQEIEKVRQGSKTTARILFGMNSKLA
jgi:nuclear pore complex protein Nup205